MKPHKREISRLLPPGYRLHELGGPGKHTSIILRPDGTPLRDEKGLSLRVPDSPSDHRFMQNTTARIRRALRQEGLDGS